MLVVPEKTLTTTARPIRRNPDCSSAVTTYSYKMKVGLTLDTNTVGLGFLHSEIGIGTVFAEIAQHAPGHSDKRRRNRQHAQRAFDVAARLARRLRFSRDESNDLSKRLNELRQAIAAIPD
jgi:hypothetical protein